ncbi:MAG: type IV secretory system conjugative DNA transfer family protein [Vicinamibacterales bacterium]
MVTVGTDLNSNLDVRLSPEGRRQGTYVLGINGTGKSNLLLDIALQDIEAGDGLCLLDPHGDLIEALLERLPTRRLGNVILFDPSDIDHPFGLNMFECDDPTNPLLLDRVCSEVVLTFKKMFEDSWGPRLEDLLRHAVLTLVAGTPGCTMLDMLPLLTDEPKRARYVSRITDPVLRHYWASSFPTSASKQLEWTAPALNKLGRFLVNPVVRNIVAQPRSAFDLRSVMDEGKVLLVNLSKGRLGEDNSSLLGSVLVGKILIAALSRAEVTADARRPFHLIVDEYHSFATESFPTLQSEARKFGIDTMVAHQYRDQLDLLNRGSTLNVGNFILFRVTGRDASELALQFDNSPPEAEPAFRAIPYPTGREGIYRTARDRVMVQGPTRGYGDVERETANFLTTSPNYTAYCNFIEQGDLREYRVRTRRVGHKVSPDTARAVRAASRTLAPSRAAVEARIRALWAADDAVPRSNGRVVRREPLTTSQG